MPIMFKEYQEGQGVWSRMNRGREIGNEVEK
jgi:hypothetical protein